MKRGEIQVIAQAIRAKVQEWPVRGTHWHMARDIACSVADALEDELKRADVSREVFLSACGVG